MAQERASRPTCMYQAGASGEPLSRVFDHPDDIPAGEVWRDSPAKVEPAARAKKTKNVPAKQAPKARPAA